MAVFEHRSSLPCAPRVAFDWHARPGAFERLAPPWERIEVSDRRGTIRDGDCLTFRLRRGPLRLTWEARHTDCQDGRSFTDEQVRGPFARWRHVHEFLPRADGACELVDRVDYALPFGPLGRALAGRATRRALQRLFAWRHERTRRDLQRHAEFAARPRLRIVIGGAGGLVGGQLCAFLSTGGHDVRRLVRRPASDDTEIAWLPETGQLDAAALDRCDAVIHLGGESIAGGRWTGTRKQAIRRSRVASTRLLSDTLARLRHPPATFLCASAVGIYGDRGDELLNEESLPGDGFLSEVCREWEAAAERAAAAGTRVACLRLGVVLSRRGGALAAMLPVFRAGLAGPLGDGRQYMSWIALEDAVAAIHHVLWQPALRGPVNLTAPHPATNRGFTRALGGVLRRPAFVPAPAAAIRLGLGEMGQALLLEGQRVAPGRLLASGFAFSFPSLEEALRWELGLSG
ncbi:MAG: TIGR01777 family oxidoreductase [Phycisphaerae bacterium]|nr:TIGR01777 family protein [Phycisphaerae bacterium]MCZ2398375.1 TIGR01777 family oxidoreductase [Phycisphaerae bacterium]